MLLPCSGHYMKLVPGLGVTHSKPTLVAPPLPDIADTCTMEVSIYSYGAPTGNYCNCYL